MINQEILKAFNALSQNILSRHKDDTKGLESAVRNQILTKAKKTDIINIWLFESSPVVYRTINDQYQMELVLTEFAKKEYLIHRNYFFNDFSSVNHSSYLFKFIQQFDVENCFKSRDEFIDFLITAKPRFIEKKCVNIIHDLCPEWHGLKVNTSMRKDCFNTKNSNTTAKNFKNFLKDGEIDKFQKINLIWCGTSSSHNADNSTRLSEIFFRELNNIIDNKLKKKITYYHRKSGFFNKTEDPEKINIDCESTNT